MPVTERKNRVYALALPLIGRRCRWQHAKAEGSANLKTLASIERAWKTHYTVGGCVQVIRSGKAAEIVTAGNAVLHPLRSVQADTVFRTASIAKAVCALLTMRLQTLGKLSVEEDIAEFWNRKIRNPHHPEAEIPLGSLLSHTSGILDTSRYFRSFEEEITADALLMDSASFSPYIPYQHFRYSNFAAGLIGSLLEARFHVSFEDLIQRELFQPLGVQATFDIRKADVDRMANSYRVLLPGRKPAFDARQRAKSAISIDAHNPQRHFLLASGNLYITVREMAKLCLVMIDGMHDSKVFLNSKSLHNLRTIDRDKTKRKPGLHHGMGLLALDDDSVYPCRLYGHQGFAYGAVNGFFFDEQGNGFVSFNSGTSEQRAGRLSCLNRDLIRAVF